MSSEQGSLNKHAVKGVVFTGGAQAIKAGLQFLSVIFLARLLTPEDFGLFASVSPLIAFVALFRNMGFQEALIQKREITQDQINRLFWFMLLIGAGFALLVAACGPLVAAFYHDPRLKTLTMVLAIPMLISSLIPIPQGLLRRDFRFGAVAMIDAAAFALGFVAALIGALCGAGYWSLAFSPLVSSVLTAAGMFFIGRWHPSRPCFVPEKEFLHFGANVTGYRILDFFATNLDNILIGRTQGSEVLGYYDRAYKLLLFPLQNVFQPLTHVMLPILSRLQDDKPRLRDAFLRVLNLLVLAIFPGIAAVAILPAPVIHLVFGPSWAPVVPIFAWLGLAGLIEPAVQAMTWLLLAQAKTKLVFRWSICSSLSTVLAFFIALPWGAEGIAAAFAISGYVVRLPMLLFVAHKAGPVTTADILRALLPQYLAAAVVWGVTQQKIFENLGLEGFTLILATVALAYTLALLFTLTHKQGRQTLQTALSHLPRRRGRKI